MTTERIKPNGDVVSIACKTPNGLLLRIFEMVDVEELHPMGSRTVKMARQIGGPENAVHIRGYNADISATGVVHPGYAITRNVPKDFWLHWLEQNKLAAVVTNGLIYACSNASDAEQEAKGREKLLSGLEPLTPTVPRAPWEKPAEPDDPRLKGIGMRGMKVTTAKLD